MTSLTTDQRDDEARYDQLDRGKIMSQEANKLQMPFSANSINSRDPISKMSINCISPFWPIQILQGQHFFVLTQTKHQAT